MKVVITLTFFFTLILHTFQQNLKRPSLDVNLNAQPSLFKNT